MIHINSPLKHGIMLFATAKGTPLSSVIVKTEGMTYRTRHYSSEFFSDYGKNFYHLCAKPLAQWVN